MESSKPTEHGVLWLLSKLTRVALAVLVLVLVVTLFIPLFRKSQRLSEEKYNLEQQIQQHESENKRLETEAAALSRDPKAVERVAREKLGWARPDEKVYRFEPPKEKPAEP
jgi:cell division protein FtsL